MQCISAHWGMLLEVDKGLRCRTCKVSRYLPSLEGETAAVATEDIPASDWALALPMQMIGKIGRSHTHKSTFMKGNLHTSDAWALMA